MVTESRRSMSRCPFSLLTPSPTRAHGKLTATVRDGMEKFRTHAGPKTFEDIMSETLKRPKPSAGQVFAAQAVLPGENPNETVKLGPVDYEVKDSALVTAWEKEVNGFFGDDRLYGSTFSTATGPAGPYGSGPYGVPPGANGPAGPPSTTGFTAGFIAGGDMSGPRPERDRPEVDLRKAIRRCHKEGVPVDRMVEIFRLELVDIVHDD